MVCVAGQIASIPAGVVGSNDHAYLGLPHAEEPDFQQSACAFWGGGVGHTAEGGKLGAEEGTSLCLF